MVNTRTCKSCSNGVKTFLLTKLAKEKTLKLCSQHVNLS